MLCIKNGTGIHMGTDIRKGLRIRKEICYIYTSLYLVVYYIPIKKIHKMFVKYKINA